jgi:glycosyltransferase
MKVSIITVSYNAERTIENTINSVLKQSYNNIEYIIIDGNSKDSTMKIVNRYKGSITKIVSENDKGIYDAMNKGIKISSGDIIGILNADDVYFNDNVIEKKISVFKNNKKINGCYSNLIYISKYNKKIVRNWISEKFLYKKIKYGWTIPHPTLFLRKQVYKDYGLYDLNFGNAADYEFILKIILDKEIDIEYIDFFSVKMLTGGSSNKSIKNIFLQNIKILNALDKHNIRYSKFSFFTYKILNKFKQYL